MGCGNLLTDEELEKMMRESGWLPKNPRYKSHFDKHHLYPQKFESFFNSKGVDIDKFSTRLERSSHRRDARAYNEAWDTFIKNHGEQADKWELAKFAAQLEEDFGIAESDKPGPYIEPY